MSTGFDSVGAAALDAIARFSENVISLALESGAVVVDGFLRRRPIDWPSPAGSMSGSGWQIVCKASDVSESDLEAIGGRMATVDGTDYRIVAATPHDAGLLIVDLGYAGT